VIRQFSVTTNRTERLLWSTEGIKFIPGEEQLLPQEARKRKRNAAIKTESHLGYLRHSWLPRIPPPLSSAPHYYLATTTTITVCVWYRTSSQLCGWQLCFVFEKSWVSISARRPTVQTFSWFLCSLHSACRVVPQIRPQPLTFTLFVVYCLLITLFLKVT
jgi:hypothetical protein